MYHAAPVTATRTFHVDGASEVDVTPRENGSFGSSGTGGILVTEMVDSRLGWEGGSDQTLRMIISK